MNRILSFSLLLSLFIGGLYLSSLYSYLLFHTLVEAFTIIVMSSTFFLAWNTRQWMEDNYFLFIGIAFLFVASIEVVHALAYKGMNIFSGYDANLPTQLWILGRYMLGISLLIAPVWREKRFPVWPVLAGYFFLTTFSLWLVFSGRFPASYVEGMGLTDFKVSANTSLSCSFPVLLSTCLPTEPGSNQRYGDSCLYSCSCPFARNWRLRLIWEYTTQPT